MKTNRHGIANNDSFGTPEWLKAYITENWGAWFDPCPFNPAFVPGGPGDGLLMEWGSITYCNPPYNRDDKPKFIQKAHSEWMKGKTVIMLLPVCTSPALFWDILVPCSEVYFFDKRIVFEGTNSFGNPVDNKPTHDSMLCVFTPGKPGSGKINRLNVAELKAKYSQKTLI